MMEAGRFRLDDFDLYKAAREFRKKTYHLVRQLPAAEVYCLDRQMRRAAVSVTNNIAEGHGRWPFQENMRFLRIARGSVDELIDGFNVCDDESYGNRELVAEFKRDADALIVRINGYLAEQTGNKRLIRSGKQPTTP